jgi:hypothetical protein
VSRFFAEISKKLDGSDFVLEKTASRQQHISVRKFSSLTPTLKYLRTKILKSAGNMVGSQKGENTSQCCACMKSS